MNRAWTVSELAFMLEQAKILNKDRYSVVFKDPEGFTFDVCDFEVDEEKEELILKCERTMQ